MAEKKNKEFVIPQKEADKLKEASNFGANIFLALIVMIVALIGVFIVYWTQIADREFPIRIEVEEAEARSETDG